MLFNPNDLSMIDNSDYTYSEYVTMNISYHCNFFISISFYRLIIILHLRAHRFVNSKTTHNNYRLNI